MDIDLILTKGMSAAIVLLFFAAVLFFLRRLYGPGGWLRDPEWDRWNADALRAKVKAAESDKDRILEQTFLTCARGYLTGKVEDDRNIELKIEHSMRVLDHARELAASEQAFATPVAGRCLRLAALFHDVGRFEQYARYKTFADDLSCNHGLLGAKILRQQGFLDSEEPATRKKVMGAVASHNRLTVPKSMSGTQLDVLSGLRDADKLDILRIMADHLRPGGKADSVVLLHLTDQANAYSPAVLAALERGHSALYRDMRYTNDFRLLLCSWLFDFTYETSYAIIRRSGYYGPILQGLIHIPKAYAAAQSVIFAKLGKI